MLSLVGLLNVYLNLFYLHTNSIHSSKEIIGKRIKLLREEKKLTQQDLADLLNVDKQYVWKLEKGKKNLTMDYLDKLIHFLDCKHEDFLISKYDSNHTIK